MGISFAGFDLLHPDPEGRIQDWFSAWLPTSDSRMILNWPLPDANFAGQVCYYPGQQLPAPNYGIIPDPKINSWYRPTGASRWAFGFFLADYARLQAILGALGSNNGSGTLVMDTHPIPGHSRAWGGCYLLPPHPVSADIADAYGMWVLPIVDERWYWQFITGFETPIDNTSPTGQSWTQLLTSIATGLGITLTIDTPATAYLRPNFFVVSGTSPHGGSELLDAAAWSIGQRIVPTYPAIQPNTGFVAGQWSSLNWNSSLTRRTANLSQQYDLGGLQAGAIANFPQQAALAPSSITVAFRAYKDGIVIHDWKTTRYQKTITAATAGYIGGTTSSAVFGGTILSTAVADYSTGGGNPDNQAALDALALQIAQDYYKGIWIQDSSIAGISQWQESGYDDYVEFTAGRPDGVGPEPRTRIHSTPYNLFLQNLLHYDSTTWEYGDKIYGTLDSALSAGGTANITLGGADGAVPSGTTHIKVTEVLNASYSSGDHGCAVRFGDKWGWIGGGASGSGGGSTIYTGTFAAVTTAGNSNTFTKTLGGTVTATVPIGVCTTSRTYMAVNISGTDYIINPDEVTLCQFSSAVVAGNTGTATIYTGTLGSETSSGVTVTAEVRRGVCVTGRTYQLEYHTSGWEVQNPDLEFIGQIGSLTDCTSGATVTVTVYSGTQGSETTQSVTVSAYARKGIMFASQFYKIIQGANGFEVVDPSLTFRGKPGSDVASDASGSMVIWTGTGAGSASGTTISSIRNDTSCTVKASKFAYAIWCDSLNGWAFAIFHSQ